MEMGEYKIGKNAYMKKYRNDNKDKIREATKKYREKNWEKDREIKRVWTEKNRESINEKRREYYKRTKLFTKRTSNNSGKKHYNWKGGKIIQNGYRYILNPEHPKAKSKKGYVAEHTLIMEKHLGRFLEGEELIHHIDFDKLNNHLNNLKLFKNHKEHMKFHSELKNNNGGFIKWIVRKLLIGLKKIIS